MAQENRSEAAQREIDEAANALALAIKDHGENSIEALDAMFNLAAVKKAVGGQKGS